MAVQLFNNGTHACLAFYDLVDEEADHAVQCNQFLIVDGQHGALIDPGGNLAYGETARRPGMPFGTLVFDVELISIKSAPKPIPAPADVAAAPKDAKKTASGLAYKVLQKGTGTKHPLASNQVSVHYTGWTTEGKMFDSSVMRGEPTSFPLDAVIKGWTEGVQLMVEGEKTRFWIPANLAYGENPRPGAPKGMLVFDVELLKILNGENIGTLVQGRDPA